MRRALTLGAVLFMGVFIGRLSGATQARTIPMWPPTFANHTTNYDARPDKRNELSEVSSMTIRGRRQTGSDQHMEWDTFVRPGATTPLLINGIGNVLVAPGSAVTEARVWQAGAHVGGNVGTLRMFHATLAIEPTANIGQAVFFSADMERGPQVKQKLSFVDNDPTSMHVLRGTTTMDAIQFTNGWSIRVDGAELVVVDPRGQIKQFR